MHPILSIKAIKISGNWWSYEFYKHQEQKPDPFFYKFFRRVITSSSTMGLEWLIMVRSLSLPN